MSTSRTSYEFIPPPNPPTDSRSLLLDLMERAGFKIRGRRATCIYCEGTSKLTVSIHEDTFYCFRCGRKNGINGLRRELGIISSNPAARAQFAAERREREKQDRVREQFERWRDAASAKLTHEHWKLSRKATVAAAILRVDPESACAWEQLENFYNAEARLLAALDTLLCMRGSAWLELDMRREKLFEMWKRGLL